VPDPLPGCPAYAAISLKQVHFCTSLTASRDDLPKQVHLCTSLTASHGNWPKLVHFCTSLADARDSRAVQGNVDRKTPAGAV